MDFDSMFLDARSLYTVLSFLTFIGIVFWAYSARRSEDFEAAANLPFADEKDIQVSEK
ncbi:MULTISPECIES: cbb3-type cytochrome c oxidase subunit 3 [Oxalobacteraceae]|jgi:cytochrome c oxidase cbb3-type subunit 4|uniref:cbb3-type cytochrome oxidase subunit 3 n=1 Tax=Oxalobacteraceae TaxID=75682 RepID=UPI0010A5730B|nr:MULTISPECIES: cbb3-type cytochrome c oxidase subunit 3 [Oxalobacteraceae]